MSCLVWDWVWRPKLRHLRLRFVREIFLKNNERQATFNTQKSHKTVIIKRFFVGFLLLNRHC